MSVANAVYAVVYTRLVPWIYKYRRRASERVPFSLSLTFLINRLLTRRIEPELIGWEPYLKERFLVGEGFTVLDVGANIGQWTLWLARQVGPQGHVVAIEPDPEANLWLRRNTGQMENVVVLLAAAWREDTVLALSRSRVSFMSSVHEAAGKRGFVRAFTLNTIVQRLGLARVDAIKMDVEGAEEASLEGAAKVLLQCKLVLVEIHEPREIDRLTKMLGRKGFKVETVRERWLLGTKS